MPTPRLRHRGGLPAAARPAPAEAAEITAPPAAAARRPADPRTGAAALPAADAVAGTQESAPREERQAVLVGYGVKLGRTTRRQRKPAAAGRGGGRRGRTRPRPAEAAAAAAAAGPAAAVRGGRAAA